MMVLEQCPTTEELRDLTLGKLSEDQSDEILAHLPNCEACQTELTAPAPAEDTLVEHLRQTPGSDEFLREKECQLAMARALGALAGDHTRSIQDSEIAERLPEVLDEYEIVRPIGQGGMGSVYLARHTRLGRQVALKVLSSHRLLQPRMRQRFEMEMRAVGQLSHPNIVTAHDARDVDGFAVLVTEFIDGLDVGQILRRTGRLTVTNACEIARQTAAALQYIDDKGLVHRDIKPSNIMLGTTGNVKLLDLGLARLQLGDGDRVDITATGQAMGTADYVAPEQVSDSSRVDMRADIYALGCTLYKMLCGQPPFDDARYPTVFAKMTAHISDAPPSLSELVTDLPTELVQFVHRMISKNANERPQSAGEIVKVLQSYSDGADLQLLVQNARTAKDEVRRPESIAIPAGSPRQPESGSFLSRRVPMLTAIAAGVFGILIGLALGVILTIRHSDGTLSKIQLPPGAIAKVSPEGNVQVELGAGQSTENDRPVVPDRLNANISKDQLQGIWRTNGAPTRGQIVVAFKDFTYFTFMNGEYMQSMTYAITATNRFATLNFNGPDSVNMQAVVQFEGDGRIKLQTQSGSMTLERIARLPVTPETLTRISEDPDTVMLLPLVRRFAEFEKTGDFPVSPRMMSVRGAAMQSRSRNNLKQIGLALHNYVDATKGEFPPADIQQRADIENSTGIGLSWRVAILPYMGEQELYDAFKLDEAWDSPHNQKLIARMPVAFRAPSAQEGSTETPYLAVVGPQTIISEQAIRMRDVRDGTARTVMLVETTKTVPWTKPEDITFDASGELPELTPVYDGGFHVAFADVSIRLISSDTPEKELRALFTRDGGEKVTTR